MGPRLTPSSLPLWHCCHCCCVDFRCGSIKNVWIIAALENNKRLLFFRVIATAARLDKCKEKRSKRSGWMHMRPIKTIFTRWEWVRTRDTERDRENIDTVKHLSNQMLATTVYWAQHCANVQNKMLKLRRMKLKDQIILNAKKEMRKLTKKWKTEREKAKWKKKC